MLSLVARRPLLAAPTPILAPMLVFAPAEWLPGDMGHSILGPCGS